jgi:ankyrin repeat protein
MNLTRTGIIPLLFFIFSILLATPALSDIKTTLKAVDKSIRLRQYSQAVEQLQPLLKRNIAEAQYRMAGLFRSGKGVKSDLDKATGLYKKAAINGLPDAQYALASILEKQDSDKKNPAEALRWFRAAADQGHQRAIKKLANLKKSISVNDDLNISQDRIFSAIRTNDLDRIRSLIKAGVSLDIVDTNLRSAFIVALQAGHREMSELLLFNSSRLDTPDSNNDRPIHIAARNGYLSIVSDLIRINIDINAQDHLGNTALIIATRHEDKNMMNLLINNNADYSIKNKKSQSAPQLAQILDLQIAKSVFVKQGIGLPAQNAGYAKVDIASFQQSISKSGSLYKGWPLLNIASLLGETAIVIQLLDQKVDILATDSSGNSAMHRAASKGQLKILKLLIKHGGNINAVNKRKETPLYLAAASGHKKTINLLVKNGADTSIIAKNKTSPLSVAISNGHQQSALALSSRRLDKASIHRALLLAIQNNMDNLGVQLIKVDKQVNQSDSKKRSALWYGADLGLRKVTIALIQIKRAPIDLADTNGYTALARAVSRGHQDIAKLLINSGASVNTVTGEKNTMLMLAVLSGKNAITNFLLSTDIDIDAKNFAGDTALMLAAATGQEAMVGSLIQAGADMLIRNMDDQNAYQIAINSGHNNIGELIKENSSALFKLFN